MNLLPCPFCGGEAITIHQITYDSLMSYARCDTCEVRTAVQPTGDKAATLWNQRTPKVEVALTEERQKNIAVCVKCWEPIELRNGQWQHMWINPHHAATPKENDQNHNNT